MATLTEALRAAKQTAAGFTDDHITSGERTAVNGHELFALWEDAEAERVQTYLKEDEWTQAVCVVTLPFKAYQSPWLAKVGASIKRVRTGAVGVIRKLDPDGTKKMTALVVMTTEL